MALFYLIYYQISEGQPVSVRWWGFYIRGNMKKYVHEKYFKVILKYNFYYNVKSNYTFKKSKMKHGDLKKCISSGFTDGSNHLIIYTYKNIYNIYI